MNMTRRRGAIASPITLGVLLVGGLVTYNIAWIILYKGRIAAIVSGHHLLLDAHCRRRAEHRVPCPREVKRNLNGRTPSLNAVTHELKALITSPSASTSKPRTASQSPRSAAPRGFYRSCWPPVRTACSAHRRAGAQGRRAWLRRKGRIRVPDQDSPLVADCIAITLQRYHLPEDAIQLSPTTTRSPTACMSARFLKDLRTAMCTGQRSQILTEQCTSPSSSPIHRYTQVTLAITPTWPRPRAQVRQAHLQTLLPVLTQRRQDQRHGTRLYFWSAPSRQRWRRHRLPAGEPRYHQHAETAASQSRRRTISTDFARQHLSNLQSWVECFSFGTISYSQSAHCFR